VVTEKKYRILVVDDEIDIATIMKLGLEKEGFQVEAITDPLRAVEFFENDRDFDLALLDIRMSPINGFELFRRLLKIDNKLRVCFMTAFEIYFDEFKRVFPKIKVDCFVHKPVSIETLGKTIRTEIERMEELEVPKVEYPKHD
jgi:DNA-binding response OmpR family regulator